MKISIILQVTSYDSAVMALQKLVNHLQVGADLSQSIRVTGLHTRDSAVMSRVPAENETPSSIPPSRKEARGRIQFLALMASTGFSQRVDDADEQLLAIKQQLFDVKSRLDRLEVHHEMEKAKEKRTQSSGGIRLAGWNCPNCKVFNGEEKEPRTHCRHCDAEKPK